MKNIIRLIFGLVILMVLTSCVNQTKTYQVKFYNDRVLVYEEEIKESYLVTPHTLENKEGYDYNWYLEDAIEPFDFTSPIKEDINLYAKWEEVNRAFVIRFLDEDRITVLEEFEVSKGTIPTVNNPASKTVNSENTKVFVSWDKEIVPASDDTDYIAIYETITKEYKISFYDDDNETLLEEFNLTKGILPNPTIPSNKIVNSEVTKVFISWDKEVESVTKDISYYAIYETIIKEYEIKWIINDNDIIINNYQYNSEIIEIEPSKVGYKFIGWDQEIPLLMPKENLEFKAIFEINQYEVKFFDENNNLIEELLIDHGNKVEPIVIDERDGYYYNWLNNGALYNFNQIIYKNITLKLTWFKDVDNYNLNIHYLNDTHGAVLKKDDELGLAYIGNYIKEQYKQNPNNSIFITGGDTFQGQLISNDNKGALMVEILNELNLDAFVIGNHEFDWGLDEIIKFFDPNYTGVKANFPLLGANIIDKRTNERPEFIDSHTIIERMGLKIGIIGVIGDGLESSIATLRVKDYYFSDAYQAVLTTANQIKDDVDVILVVNHQNDQTFNERVAGIDKVSAIFNGHTHWVYTGYINNKIPYIQSGSNGKYVGNIELEFNSNKSFVSGAAKNISYHNDLNSADYNIQNIIDSYYSEIKHLYENEILIATRSLDVDELANYISRLMKEVTGAVAGFQNSGGTRDTIDSGQRITAADIFQIFPFDNQIIYTKVTGSQLKSLLNDTYLYSSIDINYSDIINNEEYLVATNDYIYYSSYQSYAFGGKEGTLYGDMYETFYEVMLNLKENGHTHFDSDSPIILN